MRLNHLYTILDNFSFSYTKPFMPLYTLVPFKVLENIRNKHSMWNQQLPFRAQHDKEENRHASPAKCFQDTASYEYPATALRKHCWPANKILSSQQYFHASSFSITIPPPHTLLLSHLFSVSEVKTLRLYTLHGLIGVLLSLCSTSPHYTKMWSDDLLCIQESIPATRSKNALRDI